MRVHGYLFCIVLSLGGRCLAQDTIEILFTYGSEKQSWVREVTNAFNNAQHKVDGKVIKVDAKAMGSGECVSGILSGETQAHLTSPASNVFVATGNAQSQVKEGKPLLGETENLVLSPVVIAMWEPMATAIGYGEKPIGWGDIISLAKNPQGWGAYDYPEWGRFKFGHTHPEYSNSGVIAVLAEIYAGTGRQRGLTMADLENPKTAQFLSEIEQSIVHYGSSTGFFGRKMFANGPAYMSAAVLYENMVIESYSKDTMLPLVAIYPKEGTFWSDHPVGIVNRPWVTSLHAKACQAYIDYLLAKPQQQAALKFGFRPADPAVAVTSPIDTEHGVKPDEPKSTLEVPPANLITKMIEMWHVNKKHANIALVIDVSGSMSKERRIQGAKEGALAMIEMMKPGDRLSLMTFNNKINWLLNDQDVSTEQNQLRRRVKGLFPGGGTALYDATKEAFTYLQEKSDKSRISAVVVLSDGGDTNSTTKLEDLLQAIEGDNETKTTRVFTIGYGGGANMEILDAISDKTQAKSYRGTNENIKDVFKDIATFF